MNRTWAISISVSVGCHLGFLYALQFAPDLAPGESRNTEVELTLIAAPSEPASFTSLQAVPVSEPVPSPPRVEERSVEIPAPVEPLELTDQLPLPEPPPVQPTVTTPPPKQIAFDPPPSVPVRGDGSSLKPGLDTTTVTAQTRVRIEPRYVKNPKPSYPLLAKRRRQEGQVLLLVKMTAQGRAERVEVKQSSGYPLLDNSALQAVREYEFEPARIAGLAIESETEVPVRFSLTD